ncbi:MAG: SMC family ATPase [Dehalococcoidales bacterium]
MIPVRLKMRNFMCYRDNVPALDFTGLHLACLSGDNGNGKSAIIDAITWALWGKARAASDDDLIHTTQSEMEVEFEFNIGDQLYRIIRKRARPKKQRRAGQSSLEFQINNNDGFRPITGNTIAETQQKIIEVLHMDYDTFINSAYLRQGHADEFTTRKPAERKEVLGNILGLDIYDQLEVQAKEMVKQFEADNVQLENTLQEINIELAQKADFESELEKAQSVLKNIDAAAKEKEAAFNKLRQQKEALEVKRAQLDELEARISTSQRNLQRWEEQAAQHQVRFKQYEELIGRRAEIVTGYAQYAEVKKAVDELDQKSLLSRKLEEQRNLLDRIIEQAKNELLKNHAVIESNIREHDKKIQALPELKSQLTQAQAQTQKLDEAETKIRQQEQSAREAQSQISLLNAENSRLEKEIVEAAEKLDMIASHIASHTEAKCPLCEQELTKEGLELINAKYTKEKQEKTDLLNQNRESLSQRKTAYEVLLLEKAKFEAALNQEKNKIQSQIGAITREISSIEEESEKLAQLKSDLSGIEEQLAKRNFAISEQQNLTAIEADLGKLGYDAVKHEQGQQQLKQLETFQRDEMMLDEAEKLIDQEKESVKKAGEEAQALRESLKIDSQKKETLAAELTRLPQLREELAVVETEYKDINTQRNRAQEGVGIVRAKLQRLADLEVKKKEKESQISQSSKEVSIYRELTKAFGKTGIQALIIETALPEIAEEANRLLSQLTDGKMTVDFKTQRETKKGTVQETLDIVIGDELGTRNYEMFSGGEAFRINFAVRIALSRLLARRAGSPLPTLIIDEGFGTQDSTGMEKLKEAINSIQGDFEKILVITHMEELKDAFPTRIDITKTAAGSTITIN